MPFLVHSLGDRMYGLWMIIGSFIGFYWILDLGLDSATQRYISRSIGANDEENANIFVNTSLFLFSLLGIVALIFTFVLIFVSKIFTDNASLLFDFRITLFFVGISFSLRLPMSVFSSILSAHLRFDILSVAGIVKLFIRTASIYIFLSNGHGIISLGVISFFSDLLEYFFNFYMSRQTAPYVHLALSNIDSSKLRPLFSFSASSFLAKLADNLRFNIDNLIIVTFLGLNAVTIYSIASRLLKYFMDLMATIFGIVMPIFSAYEGQGRFDIIREKYLFISKISSCVSMIIGSSLIMFGQDFIRIWMGQDYIASYFLLVLLTLPTTLVYMQGAVVGLLRGISKHHFYAILNLVEGVANLILSFILVQKFGLKGVALGTAIPMILIKIFCQPIYVCNVLHLSVSGFYRDIYFKTLLKFAPMFYVFYLICGHLFRPTYSHLFCFAVIYILYCCAFLFLFIFNRQERQMLTTLISRFRKSL